MEKYAVLFRDDTTSDYTTEPLCFLCQADDLEHAEEQCENSYPNCEIVWVYVIANK